MKIIDTHCHLNDEMLFRDLDNVISRAQNVGVEKMVASLPDQTYRITNLMGQTLLQGTLHKETQQINIEKLPVGMYFINVGEQTVIFVVK